MYCLIRFAHGTMPRATYLGAVTARQVYNLSKYEIIRVVPDGINNWRLIIITRQLVRLQRVFRWYLKTLRILLSLRTLARREQGFPPDPLPPPHPETRVRGTLGRLAPPRRVARTGDRQVDRRPPTSGDSASQ